MNISVLFTNNLKYTVNVYGIFRSAVLLVIIKVGLAIRHNPFGIDINRPLERFVISRPLRAKPPLEALLYGKHFDVVDAVPATRLSRGPRW